MIIVADTATEIYEKDAEQMGVRLVSITSSLADRVFDRNTEEEFALFYEKLENTEELPVSSQPSPDKFLDIFEEAKEKNEEVLVVTLSHKLSGTYNCAVLAADMAEYDKIYVVDSLQASIAEMIVVKYAVQLRDNGMSAKGIAHELESFKTRVALMGVPSTLLYLKKGGRISNVKAALGSALDIKPLLKLIDGKIESIGNVRGLLHAKKEILKAFMKDEKDPSFEVYFGHSNDEEMGRSFKDKVCEECGLSSNNLYNVGPAIGTHIGPKAILIAYVTK